MSFHQKVPPVGTRCGDPRCGQSTTKGHPRTGWIRVFVAGSHDPAVWYDSWECLVYATGVRPALAERAVIWPRDRRHGFTVDEAITLINRYSRYTLQTLGLTRPRLNYAYKHAVAHLIIEHPQYDEVRFALAAARGVLLGVLPEEQVGPDPQVAEDGADEAVGY